MCIRDSHHGDHIGLLTQILSLLARSAPQPEPNKLPNPHRAVTTALKLIDDSLADNWTLARLSELVQVESTYFVRLFRTAIGLPPMAYILRRRLELATHLLRRVDLSISEAGAMAGWMDGNYFSRSFRQHFGMTPTESVSYTHLDVYKRQVLGLPAAMPITFASAFSTRGSNFGISTALRPCSCLRKPKM